MGYWGEQTIETLRCDLTAEERVAKSLVLAQHLQETAKLEEEKAKAVRAYAEQLKERKTLEQSLTYDVATGTEERPVSVYERPRPDDLLVDVIRTDTNTVHRTRAMQPKERQMSFGDMIARDALRNARARRDKGPESDDDDDETPGPSSAH